MKTKIITIIFIALINTGCKSCNKDEALPWIDTTDTFTVKNKTAIRHMAVEIRAGNSEEIVGTVHPGETLRLSAELSGHYSLNISAFREGRYSEDYSDTIREDQPAADYYYEVGPDGIVFVGES